MDNLDKGSVTDEQAARHLANGHPKSNPPTLQDPHQGVPFGNGSGEAPGANGPPTTGAMGPGGPLS